MHKLSKALILTAGFILINVLAMTQNNDITKLASEILENNPDLKVMEKIAEERFLEIKTGINPEDPRFEYQRSQEVGGSNPTQKFSISQRFDFPTSYMAANKLRKAKQESIALELNAYKQELRVEICKDLVSWLFLTKKETILKAQYDGALELEKAITKQFENGETGILEYNKMKLFVRQTQNKLKAVQIQKQKQYLHLQKLNGGEALALANVKNTEFDLQNEEQFMRDFEQNDAIVLQYKAQVKVANSNIRFMQSKWLPNFGVGVGSERNQTAEFRGITLGMNIPLWEKRHTVSRAKAGEDRAQTELNSVIQTRLAELQIAREQAILNKELFENLQEMYSSYNSQILLQRALESGYISLIDFLREYNEYYLIEIEIMDQEEVMNEYLIEANKYRL